MHPREVSKLPMLVKKVPWYGQEDWDVFTIQSNAGAVDQLDQAGIFSDKKRSQPLEISYQLSALYRHVTVVFLVGGDAYGKKPPLLFDSVGFFTTLPPSDFTTRADSLNWIPFRDIVRSFTGKFKSIYTEEFVRATFTDFTIWR